MLAYSLIWMNRNVHPSRNGREDARLQAPAVAVLDRSLGPVHRERGDRIAVFTPATCTGSFVPGRATVALGDADEEVGGEERPEDHHLGDDEKQHPQQLGVDARAAVAGGGPWCSCSPVPAAWATLAASIRSSSGFPPRSAGRRRVAGRRRRRARPRRRSRRARARSGSSAATRSARPGSVEMTTSSTVNSSSAFIAAV